MDVGVSTKEPVSFAPGFVPVAESGGRFVRPPGAAPATRDVLLDADRALAQAVARDGAGRAYERVLTSASRLHVPGPQPLVGRQAALAWLNSAPPIVFTPDAGEIADSGDLGFTRGAYAPAPGGAAAGAERGFYVRTWKRGADGAWTLGVEVRHVLREAPPQ
jgi:hypothetical protein